MNEAKFTKGPWVEEYGNCDHGSGQWYCVGPATVKVPYRISEDEREEWEANAHLIVAAPDMYEALEQLLGNAEIAQFHLRGTEEAEIVSSSLFDTINQARASLAKARGEQ